MTPNAATDEPSIVTAARRRAGEVGFTFASDPVAGRLLATLAAAVPAHGRILELGSGTGVGTAWLVAGLDPRDDVEVTTVEADARLAEIVRGGDWPAYVQPVEGDAVVLLPQLGGFDLIFADAEGGKWTGLDLTIAALRPGGVLVVDDMDLARYSQAEHREHTTRVRDRLVGDPQLVTVELEAGTGFVLATRRHHTG